ncbi:MAG: right-handed parallel beta-helix repeat-containing protein [Phycisphaerales bacterium]|nr:right-handed parallel beta-helix repeat-containing protein [Phycisphaerales bacterium]
MKRGVKNVCGVSVLAMIAGGAIVLAGPIDPPAGPVKSTYKTLNEIEPRTAINATNTPGDASAQYVITQPGSYYLTGDLAITSGAGVSIRSSNVRIDLNGFALRKAGAIPEIAIEIPDDGLTYRAIDVRNGSVTGSFAQGGIMLGEGEACRVSDVTVTGVPDVGIDVGPAGVIERSVAAYCKIGLSASQAEVLDCVASNCSSLGISLLGSRARGCLSRRSGDWGFLANTRSVVEDCVARDNDSGGPGGGIYVFGQGNRIDGNTVTGGWSGIALDSGATDALVTRNNVTGAHAGWAYLMFDQGSGSFPNNHIAQILSHPTSQFNSSNAWANFEY